MFTNRITFSQIVEEQRRRRLEASGNADAAPQDPLANDENSAAATSHPLLMRRHSTSQSQDGNSRNEVGGRGSGRTARARRFNYMNMNGRSANPPIILQRLLGPSNSGTPGTVTLRDSTRVVLMDNTFSFIPGNDDDNGDHDHGGGGSYMYGGRSSSTQSSNNNTALNWWFEESKILGLESQPDICLTVCADLVPDLELHKAADLAKNRSKRKKKLEEEEAAKARATTSATIETRISQIASATSRATTQFAQALNLMDTSEPQQATSDGSSTVNTSTDPTASTVTASAVENHNITATSSQLEEMQISQDSIRPEATSTPLLVLNPIEQNQVNAVMENIHQGQQVQPQEQADQNRDAEMSDAAERDRRLVEESEDSADDHMHSQFISIYSDEVNSDDDDDDSDEVSL